VALEAHNLTYRYDALEALRGVSISVNAGEAVAVAGVNGAGKTTLVKVLSGFLSASSGEHSLFGERMQDLSAREHMRRGAILVPEGRHLVTRLSVNDNLLLGASCFGAHPPAVEDLEFVFETFPELVEHRHRPAGSLSGGQQQMVAIGRALVARPKVLLMDEPSQGLAPFLQERLAQSFVALLDAGITLIVVEQNLSFARQCTSRLYSIVGGEVDFSGSWEQFSARGGLVGTSIKS
jgi:branched-chain amino acid transport system ATP-binding protein